MSNEILTQIKLDLDQLRADLKESEKLSRESGKKGGEGLGGGIEDGFSKAFGGIKGKLLALGASIAGAFTLKESIAQSIEQQNAINALNSSMALAGQYSAAASQRFQEFAENIERTTKAQSEAVLQGGSLLVSLGRLSGEGLQRASQAAVDFAAGMAGQGMTVETAFSLVAKASAGNVGALSRYGIQVQETGNKTADFNNALMALEARFRGMAALQAGTFDGAQTQMMNGFNNILKAIGNLITSSPTATALLGKMAEAFNNVATAITNWGQGHDRVKEFVLLLIEAGKALTLYVGAPAEMVFNFLKLGFEGARYWIQAFITKTAEGLALVTGWLAPINSTFAGINTAVQTFMASSQDTLNQFAQSTVDAESKLFNFDATAKAEEFLVNSQAFVNAVKQPVADQFKQISDGAKMGMGEPTFFDSFTAGFMKNTQSMAQAAFALGQQIRNTIATGVTNSFAAMGAAMVKGENGMAAFGKAMLGVLGDIAIQFGSFFIMMGIGKSLLFDPTGPALIAAGAALAVLGGALKAIAGGGGSPTGASAPSTGGGVVAGGGAMAAPVSNEAQSFNNVERGEVGAKVEVNVQGNILDRRQTGLELVEVINEAFGNNAVAFTGA